MITKNNTKKSSAAIGSLGYNFTERQNLFWQPNKKDAGVKLLPASFPVINHFDLRNESRSHRHIARRAELRGLRLIAIRAQHVENAVAENRQIGSPVAVVIARNEAVGRLSELLITLLAL